MIRTMQAFAHAKDSLDKKYKNAKVFEKVADRMDVGMAKIRRDETSRLEVSIIKATKNDENIPKEKHVRILQNSCSVHCPRQQVNYIIHVLGKRLEDNQPGWVIVLKSLIVFHRLMREVDPSFLEEFLHYGERTNLNRLLRLETYFDRNHVDSWDYSSFIRVYGIYLDERLTVFRAMKFDPGREGNQLPPPAPGTQSTALVRVAGPTVLKSCGSKDLLLLLPLVEKLLLRLLNCVPEGRTRHDIIVQYSCSLVLRELGPVYKAMCEGVMNLTDKFFEMGRVDALKGLDLYKEYLALSEKINGFFGSLESIGPLRNLVPVPSIQAMPPDFLSTMEEYVKNLPRTISAAALGVSAGKVGGVVSNKAAGGGTKSLGGGGGGVGGGKEDATEEKRGGKKGVTTEKANDDLGKKEEEKAKKTNVQVNLIDLDIAPSIPTPTITTLMPTSSNALVVSTPPLKDPFAVSVDFFNAAPVNAYGGFNSAFPSNGFSARDSKFNSNAGGSNFDMGGSAVNNNALVPFNPTGSSMATITPVVMPLLPMGPPSTNMTPAVSLSHSFVTSSAAASAINPFSSASTATFPPSSLSTSTSLVPAMQLFQSLPAAPSFFNTHGQPAASFSTTASPLTSFGTSHTIAAPYTTTYTGSVLPSSHYHHPLPYTPALTGPALTGSMLTGPPPPLIQHASAPYPSTPLPLMTSISPPSQWPQPTSTPYPSGGRSTDGFAVPLYGAPVSGALGSSTTITNIGMSNVGVRSTSTPPTPIFNTQLNSVAPLNILKPLGGNHNSVTVGSGSGSGFEATALATLAMSNGSSMNLGSKTTMTSQNANAAESSRFPYLPPRTAVQPASDSFNMLDFSVLSK
eukprot:CAMPEP_0175051678 /NCGR_PEP_ID=MMETSP0052_2-20121109/7941_1 /TAXON_ID=51329 ORGANISM="Polytomella parva, Strain SAG 63-3" /NCGR_SAMPLE_ID=MMETSP0052_2 /ASSEMBLY_ACC=CAM_ASM_000194 /LENGTH=852 /DNA_ID=CAMNT_0016316005 /DNA_START=883 /DNA_END=3441 /DNA_ORIENTATION=-